MRSKILRFDVNAYLAKPNGDGKVTPLGTGQVIFSQGEQARAVFYIQDGRVKLTTVSARGKEAVIGILDAGAFFGEGCLSVEPIRLCSATAITNGSILQIGKAEMLRVLKSEPKFADFFLRYVISRNSRIEADLVDQLFNSSEKRLARALLLLAHYGKDKPPETVIPKISQQTLAELIGTTRSRVGFFMRRFENLGYINYNNGLGVSSSLLKILLND